MDKASQLYGDSAWQAARTNDGARNRVEAKVANNQDSLMVRRQEMERAGIWLCSARCPETRRFCTRRFLTEEGLKMHKAHRFPIGIRPRDKLILALSKPGGVLAAGSRPDCLTNSSFVTVVAATVGASGTFAAWCFGAFNRKEETKGY